MEVTKGQIVDGIVTGIKPYGAFIEIENGPVALAYIEDLSVVRIKSPAERVQVGQKIKCMVKSIKIICLKKITVYIGNIYLSL